MDLAASILSDITVYMKYAKFIEAWNRRENWNEIIDRNKMMHMKRYLHLRDEIEAAYNFVYEKKVLPSMRSLQFGGKPIEINNVVKLELSNGLVLIVVTSRWIVMKHFLN